MHTLLVPREEGEPFLKFNLFGLVITRLVLVEGEISRNNFYIEIVYVLPLTNKVVSSWPDPD